MASSMLKTWDVFLTLSSPFGSLLEPVYFPSMYLCNPATSFQNNYPSLGQNVSYLNHYGLLAGFWNFGYALLHCPQCIKGDLSKCTSLDWKPLVSPQRYPCLNPLLQVSELLFFFVVVVLTCHFLLASLVSPNPHLPRSYPLSSLGYVHAVLSPGRNFPVLVLFWQTPTHSQTSAYSHITHPRKQSLRTIDSGFVCAFLSEFLTKLHVVWWILAF